jgi:hypothetical protein
MPGIIWPGLGRSANNKRLRGKSPYHTAFEDYRPKPGNKPSNVLQHRIIPNFLDNFLLTAPRVNSHTWRSINCQKQRPPIDLRTPFQEPENTRQK